MNIYETEELVNQYCEFHYGDSYFGLPNYPERCAALAIDYEGIGGPWNKALDLGCAVGRSTFELARTFKKVVGVDLSQRFIDTANEIQRNGHYRYFRVDQGEIGEHRDIYLDQLGLTKFSDKVEFQCTDACALGDEHRDYDLVFAGNLLDRLQQPDAFLKSLARLVRPGGLYVQSSPYTLMTEFTPRENWLGGFVENKQPVTVYEGMKRILEPEFESIITPIDVPFVMRETARKYQHSIAEMSVWRKK